MASRLGENIAAEHSGSNRQAVADGAVNMHAPFHLILDDYISGFFFVKQLKVRAKWTTPIHRRYWYKNPSYPDQGGWDGSLHRAPGITALNIVNVLEGAQKAHGVFPVMEQLYNEPDVHGDELRVKNKLIVDTIKEGAPRGMTFCADNPQERSVWQTEIDAGFYDELLRTLAQYPQNVLGVHSYGLGFLPANISNAAIAKLGVVGAFPYEAWAVDTPAQITAQKQAFTANWQESHLCSGSVGLVRRAKALGIAAPRIVKTESWWDLVRLGDNGLVTAQVQGLNDGLPPMGYPTLDAYWKKQFPYFTKEQAAFEQLRWQDVVEIGEVAGICGYSVDVSFENGRYNLPSGLIQRIANYNVSQIGTTPTQPPPIPVPMTDSQRIDDHEKRLKALEQWRISSQGDGK